MDMNRTHMFNPDWTPHAKFHDAWTIQLAAALGLGALYALHAPGVAPQARLTLGAGLPAIVWITQAGSFAFPGAAGLDAEFPDLMPSVGPIPLNEWVASVVMLGLGLTGYLLARQEAE
jgi:hypothetical protein